MRRIDINDEVKGWHELQRALELGRVKSSGRDVATGSKREVSQLEWEDLRFANPLVIEEAGYQYVHAEPQLYWEKDVAELWRRPTPAFRDVRVLVADVLNEFPAKQTSQALAPEEVAVAAEQPSSPRRRRQATLLTDVKRLLLDLYPAGKPRANCKVTQKAVMDKLGRTFSIETLDRAIKEAWPTSSNVVS